MAFVPLVPATANASIVQGLGQQLRFGPVVTAAGVVVDMSAWFAYKATMAAPQPVPYAQDTDFGTVTGDAAGYLYLTTSHTDLATVPAGSAKLLISAKKLTGDDFQLVGSGTLTVNNG